MALLQFADNTGPDQPAHKCLHCQHTELVDTVVYVDRQRLLRSDCIDAHADLDLRCPQFV